MANFSVEIGQARSNIVKSTSRYFGSKVYQYSDDKLLTFEIYKRRPIPPPSENDQWLEITPAVEYRPDLVSYEIYGSPDFWWRIMEINGMKDILEFKSGRNIRVSGSIFRE
jgi:hypothetical protein